MSGERFWDLYKRNMRGTFWKSWESFEAGESKGVFALILTPITAPVGGGIKAVVDYNSRKPLPDSEIAELMRHISTMTHYDIWELMKKIITYPGAQSKSSQQLQKKLKKEAKEFLITWDTSSNTHNRKYMYHATTMVNTLRQLILDYLHAEHNRGKKMQHVIKDHIDGLNLSREMSLRVRR